MIRREIKTSRPELVRSRERGENAPARHCPPAVGIPPFTHDNRAEEIVEPLEYGQTAISPQCPPSINCQASPASSGGNCLIFRGGKDVQRYFGRTRRRQLWRRAEGNRRLASTGGRCFRQSPVLLAQLKRRARDHRKVSRRSTIPYDSGRGSGRHGRSVEQPGTKWGICDAEWLGRRGNPLGRSSEKARLRGEWLIPLPSTFLSSKPWPLAQPVIPPCCAYWR